MKTAFALPSLQPVSTKYSAGKLSATVPSAQRGLTVRFLRPLLEH